MDPIVGEATGLLSDVPLASPPATPSPPDIVALAAAAAAKAVAEKARADDVQRRLVESQKESMAQMLVKQRAKVVSAVDWDALRRDLATHLERYIDGRGGGKFYVRLVARDTGVVKCEREYVFECLGCRRWFATYARDGITALYAWDRTVSEAVTEQLGSAGVKVKSTHDVASERTRTRWWGRLVDYTLHSEVCFVVAGC
jgi:hypothetical protein